MSFNYQLYRDWLLEQIKQFERTGSEVATKENAAPVQSILVTISTKDVGAELVIWEGGSTSMIVFSIPENKYVIDQHDFILNDGNFSKKLSEFIERVPNGI